MVKLTQIAWRNLWRNWRRTLIASLAIVLGLILLIFMDALIKGSDQAIFGNAVRLYGGNIQIHAPGFREKASRLPLLPLGGAEAILEVVRDQPQVRVASLRIHTSGLISNRGQTYPVAITAIQPEQEQDVSLVAENVVQGRFLLAEDGDAILIGKGLADFFDVGVGERLILVGRRQDGAMRQRSMTIVGVYSLGLGEAEKGMVFVTLPEAQTLYGLRGQATEVTLSLAGAGGESQVVAALQAALPGVEVDSWKTLRPEIEQLMQTKGMYTTIFGLIVLMIAAIGVLNLMLMAVFERTREMGVLAALGLKGRQIMGLFVLEGALIGVIGAVAGCLLGVLLVGLVGRVGIDISFAKMGEATALMGDRLYPSLTVAAVIGDGLAVLAITALAALYPAWEASKKEPSASLHYV